jgi:MFS family permease
LEGDKRYKDAEVKIHSWHEHAFHRLAVKVKKELVAMNHPVDLHKRVALAIVTYVLVPHTKVVPQGSVLSNLNEVLSNRRVVWSCIFAGLMVGPLEGFADVWGAAFLKQVYGFDSSLAASLPSLVFIGMCFGSPILSLIADKVGSYLMTIIGAGIIMALSFFLLLTCPLSSGTLSLNFAIVGICSAYQILAIYKASTYVREEVAGLTTAVANMIIMIFGYAFHTLMGNIITFMGGPASSQALVYGISVIPIALSLGSLGFLFLLTKEKQQPLLRT